MAFTLRSNCLKLISTVIVLALVYLVYIQLKRSGSERLPTKQIENQTARRLSNRYTTTNTSTTTVVPTTENPLCPRNRQYDTKEWQIIEDILCLPPPKLLSNYKNPCWRSEVSGNLRCIPYFQIIGMDKCGTTDLFDRIVKHPEILQNDGVLNKETTWWSWHRYGHNLLENTNKQYLDDYVRYFSSAANEIAKHSNASNGFHSLITGDGTPMDMWDFTGWTQIPQNHNLSEPKYLTPHLIRHLNNKSKFIIILRNPVDRLYSDYYFLNPSKKSTRLTFHKAVETSKLDLESCQKMYSLRKCLYNRTLVLKFNVNARLHLGYYSVFLKEWFNVFPREQFLILRTEDYSSSINQHLNTIFKFLEVRQLSDEEMTKLGMLKTKRLYVTENKPKGSRGEMLDETRQILTDLYKPYIKDLNELLKDKKFLWNFKIN